MNVSCHSSVLINDAALWKILMYVYYSHKIEVCMSTSGCGRLLGDMVDYPGFLLDL